MISGLSQENVARELGMEQSQYSKLERGKLELKLHQFIKLAAVLNTTPSKLIETNLRESVSASDSNVIQEPAATYELSSDKIEKLIQSIQEGSKVLLTYVEQQKDKK